MKDPANWRSGAKTPASLRGRESAGTQPSAHAASGARRAWFVAATLLVALALGLTAAAAAHAGAAFGVRAGYANVNADAFRGSGKIGGTPLYGLQAVLPIMPFVSLVVAGEQRTKDFSFAGTAFNNLSYQGRAKWTDQALYATARVRLPGVVGLYFGAGAGYHRQKTDLSGVVPLTKLRTSVVPAARDARARSSVATVDPLSDFLSKAGKELTNPSWHAILGVEVSLPAVPLGIFAEGRVEDIQGSPPAAGAVYAGVNLQLP